MINFDALPKHCPMGTLKAGTYVATIEKAEMKQGKDPMKPPYLNLTYAMETSDGKGCGKHFDIISDVTENSHQIIKYKVRRFVEALELPLIQFELKDLTKVVVGKKLIVDIMMDKNDPPRPQVNVFGAAYYPISQFANVFGVPPMEDLGNGYFGEDINASDADDAMTSVPQTESY